MKIIYVIKRLDLNLYLYDYNRFGIDCYREFEECYKFSTYEEAVNIIEREELYGYFEIVKIIKN